MNGLWIIVGYLFGSIPTGLLVVKLVRGEDIRKHGSGNIGATNVGRVMGKPWAVFVAIADMVKGGLAVLLAFLCGVADPWVLVGVAFAGVCGHNFPLWIGFKGGKGVSTSYGVLFFLGVAAQPYGGLLWLASPLGGVIWFVLMKTTRYVSVASMLSLCLMPVVMGVLGAPQAYVAVSAALGALAVVRHHENVRRLLAGTESKVGQKKG